MRGKYRVAVAGLGARGRAHLQGMMMNPDCFEIVGLYNPGQAKRDAVREQLGLNCFFSSPEEMLKCTRPDVLCFATHPDIRQEYVDLAVRYKVKALSMEKPVALNMRDARKIENDCSTHAIKTVVCVQHKYFTQYRKLKKAVQDQAFGRVTRVVAQTLPWLHILGTHLVEYILWVMDEKGADWVAGHVSGRNKLQDTHVSPDFVMGLIHFPDGLYANLECGYLSEQHLNGEFWVDNRLTILGEDGYAWAETDGRFGLCAPCTGGRLKVEHEPGMGVQDEIAMKDYYYDLYRWLEDDNAVHPTNLGRSLAAYEILTGLCLSGLDNTRVDLPMGDEAFDVIERLKKELPSQQVPDSLLKTGFFDKWGS